MASYAEFLATKRGLGGEHGFEPLWLPEFLFDFQRALVEWAIRKGRAALWADCGLGKTPMQLVWAENVVRRENRPVMIATPLAVSHQTVEEANKFGIETVRSADGTVPTGARIVVTNYERLHLFDPTAFCGMVCDESSILKNFEGARRATITEFMRQMPYRLLCTATAAPNDFTELGTSSEALGEMGHMDMLTRFFRNDHGNASHRTRKYVGQHHVVPGAMWRFKGHAEEPFWRWVCSWARAVRKPSDLGFDDGRFVLPPLVERAHMVKSRKPRPDLLFDLPAKGLKEQRDERRRTIEERCEKVAALADHKDQVLIWCHLNPEGDLLEQLTQGAVQVSGDDVDEVKEERLLAFANGEVRALVTKPKIGALGLNLQRCAHVTFFPSHSYEQYYQGVRRCWRFGQERAVRVDIVCTDGERDVLNNLQRKSQQADKMFSRLTEYMGHALVIRPREEATLKEEVPSWLSATK